MKKIIIALTILGITTIHLKAQTTTTGTRPARKTDKTAATQADRRATRKANKMKAGDTATYPNRVPPVTSDTRSNIKK